MRGAGFMRDMISMTKNNRKLLKGNGKKKYENFDKSYITDSIISREAPIYKSATPELLNKIRKTVSKERRKNRILSFLFLILLIGFSIYFILTSVF
jgi:hypothetical protein